ncbi:hypothetical protein LCGC14_1674650 [marine sediment metagenome]|uniref:Uncharacterized protein n=1 Tax=marine sediment metagenome TaxID=412755 RepID=A0A0F9ICU9_9ZZZZ
MIIYVVALVAPDEHTAICAYRDHGAADTKAHELQQRILNHEGEWANRKDWEDYDPRSAYTDHYVVYGLEFVEQSK